MSFSGSRIFPVEVLREADALQLDDDAFSSRREVTGITIDPEDARDLDDAVSLTQNNDGSITVEIHIADVSALVQAGSLLDREARTRVHSRYFDDGTVALMLPPNLSGDRLSLVPQQRRPTITVKVKLDSKNLVIQNFIIEPTVLRSTRKLSYGEADAVARQVNQDETGRMLSQLGLLAQRLYYQRLTEGALSLDDKDEETLQDGSAETQNKFSSCRIIQELMILANRLVAQFAVDQKNPFLYRNHSLPRRDEWRREALLRPEIYEGDPGAIAMCREITAESAGIATYNITPRGHEGVGADLYTHFTSPIRRYADLVVHRNLCAELLEERLPHTPAELAVIAAIINHEHARLSRFVLSQSSRRRAKRPASERSLSVRMPPEQKLAQLAASNNWTLRYEEVPTPKPGPTKKAFSVEIHLITMEGGQFSGLAYADTLSSARNIAAKEILQKIHRAGLVSPDAQQHMVA
ncbi:MAG: RNB domain-containing ribonuclease [Patescibacteria group bacterium]